MTIGTPLVRQDAVSKVTGAAEFVADRLVDGALEGVFVRTDIGAGRVEGLDLESALDIPGVVRIFGPGELGVAGPLEHWAAGQATVPLSDHLIRHAGQPVALVVAETRAAAVAAAARVGVRFVPEAPRVGLEALLDEAIEIKDWAPTNSSVGDVAGAQDGAAVTVSERYRTADRHHAAMEPSAAIAEWTGDELMVSTSTQWVFGVRAALAQALGVPAERIRVRTGPVGGGFGAKGSTWPHEILAAAAARLLRRPVRICLSRAETFVAHGYQPATVQDVTLGAAQDGTLVAIRHESVSAAAMADDYVEHGSLGTRTMYRCPNIATRDRIVRLNRPQPTFMRAPHEGPGMTALEIAMDELAERLDLDPVELRLRNYADADPTSGKPFSSKKLRECYQLGAERFGWSRRSKAPGSMRDGPTLIGWGMASCLMSTFRFGGSARITIRRNGTVRIETGSHEIGTGVSTILPQIAAEVLGIDPAQVEVALGDTTLAEAGGTFGSATTMGVGSAVHAAATKLRASLEALAGEPGLEAAEYPEVLKLRHLDHLTEDGAWAPKQEESAYAMNAYGAVFVEVRIDPIIRMPRVSRCVGAYSVGRIINPRTARSQAIGGIVWGLGQALLEESRVDPRTGRFVAQGFGGYHVPANADVPDIDVMFAEEFDAHASTLGARGVGEIGTIGVGAAVANAVYHATGVRVRDVPIRI